LDFFITKTVYFLVIFHSQLEEDLKKTVFLQRWSQGWRPKPKMLPHATQLGRNV